MSTNLVIVAIPEEQDRVWKISSEKIPHLTLLFLGDAENNPNVQQIMQFVEHAVTLSEHGPFYLDVDRRDTLGEDEADVIVFNKRSWNLKWIKQFRSQLLQHSAIKTAYDSAEQFPEWLPHLTLGYPETPAKKLDDNVDDHLYSVCFDRIAVWTGNYEGPDFRLEWPEREFDGELAVAYADAQKAAIAHYGGLVSMNDAREAMGLDSLEHFGVKGMRWGQRKTETITENGRTRQVSSRQAKKADKKWEKDFKSQKDFGFDDEKFTKEYNAKWKDHDFSKEDWDNPSPTYQKYIDGYFNEMSTAYASQLASHFGSSPTGKLEVHHRPGTDLVEIRRKDTAQHADEELVTFKIKRDASGLIVGVEPVEDTMEQSVERGAEFLEHFGVKGMKWGVRKAKDARFHTKKNSLGTITKLVDGANSRTKEKDLPAINAKYEAKGAKTSGSVHIHSLSRVPIQKAYREEVKAAYLKNLNAVARETTNASGTRRYEITEPFIGNKPTPSRWRVKTVKIEHAEVGGDFEFDIIPVFDDDGYIVDFKLEIPNLEQSDQNPITLSHSAEIGEAFVLEHFGIKGMRWGIRRDRPAPSAVTPQATSRVPHGRRRKTKIDVEGGENHPATDDAIKVAQAKAKLKRSGTSALTNQELREIADRVRLEEQVKVLTSSRGKKFVLSELQSKQSKAMVREGVKKAGPKVAKKAAKGAATVATTAALL